MATKFDPGVIIPLVIGLVVAAVMLPIALAEFAGAEAANWGATGVTILGLMGVIIAASLLFAIYRALK